jgi:hypothetical protein
VELIPGDLIRFLHGVRKGKSHGSDGTLTDYLLEKETGMGVRKCAADLHVRRADGRISVPGLGAKRG